MSDPRFKDRKVYKPTLTAGGFVKVDGVVIGKLTPERTLEIVDKDKGRSARRGTRKVEVLLCHLTDLCEEIETP